MSQIVYQRPPLYKKQEEAIFCDTRVGVVEASVQSGKAQPLYSKVYTPTGPVRMGDVSVGDKVLTPSGDASPVTNVYPQGETSNYKVTLSDDTSVEASGDHLWYLETYGGKSALVTTKQLSEWPQWKRREYWTPMSSLVEFEAQEVPIDPWLLGILIAEGGMSTESLYFSNSDDSIVERVREEVSPYYNMKHAEGNTYRVSSVNPKASQSVSATTGVLERGGRYVAYFDSTYIGTFDSTVEARNARDDVAKEFYGDEWVPYENRIIYNLKRLGLWGCRSHEKFIPDIYKYNSSDVRFEVLRGILDGDGWVSNTSGQPRLGQTSERLAHDVREVVETLGGICGLKTKTGAYKDDTGERVECKTVYRLSIQHEDATKFFWLDDKKKLTRQRSKRVVRRVKSVERIEDTKTQCIEIDSEESLYLTDHCIATHNTVGCICWLFEKALLEGDTGKVYWWVAPISDQAELAFTRMKNAAPKETITKTISAPGKQRIELVNGAVIWFKSADAPDSLYGESVNAVVIDEATRVKEESWHAIRSRTAATEGQIRIIGNVKGRKNWAYKVARRAEQADEDDEQYHYAKITAYDAAEAGVLPWSEIEMAKDEYPEPVFRELYLAEPGDDQGNPFGIDHIHRCVFKDDKGNWQHDTASGRPVAWGWDIAKSGNYTVGIGLNRDGDVCEFHRWQHHEWEDTIRRIIRLTKGTKALVDSTTTGGDMVISRLRNDGGPHFRGYKFTTQSKQDLMLGLAVAIQNQEVGFPAGQIVKELEQFEYEKRRDRVLYSAPREAFDDCVDSLALCVKIWEKDTTFDSRVEPMEATRVAPWRIA